MEKQKLTIYHLYPDLMNTYGDRGNIIALTKRMEWRGISCTVKNIHLGEKPDFSKADIIFMGGGQDRGQKIIKDDLLRLGPEIKKAINDGLPGLVVCGGFQLFGKYFKTHNGEELKGISIFDAYTIAGPKRLIGNVIIDGEFGEIVGFENHSGQTFTAFGTKYLGKVIKGYGNNGNDEKEGMIYKNLIGTYLHGPILPKNPSLADFLITQALRRKYGEKIKFNPLVDSEEKKAFKKARDRAYNNTTEHL